MKIVNVIFLVFLLSMLGTANANDALKNNFLEACESSPHVDESSDCVCVFNEVVHQFGAQDAEELVVFIKGEEVMEKEVSDSLSFISGKCED